MGGVLKGLFVVLCGVGVAWRLKSVLCGQAGFEAYVRRRRWQKTSKVTLLLHFLWIVGFLIPMVIVHARLEGCVSGYAHATGCSRAVGQVGGPRLLKNAGRPPVEPLMARGGLLLGHCPSCLSRCEVVTSAG